MRFHIDDLSAPLVRLGDEESQHARKVMRVAVGDVVELFDGQGSVASAEVSAVGRAVELRVIERHRAERVKPWIDLAVAVPKGDRAAVLAEKAAELGADRLIPLICERSVVDPRQGKVERWRRIAVEAAKQCGRPWGMEVAEPAALAKVLREVDHEVRLIADTGEAGVSRTPPRPRAEDRVLVLIGPEGGWTEGERTAAALAGFTPWRLGPYVLRIETAALAALAKLRG